MRQHGCRRIERVGVLHRRHQLRERDDTPGVVPPIRYLHLTPAAVWAEQVSADCYRPEMFDVDGFIHCTIGENEVLAVGDRYYAADPRQYVVVEIEPSRLTVPVRFEDSDRTYPHLHGPVNRDAVVSLRRVRRGADGSFLAIETE
jgi:uncharacterized protein (DUF952 family)